MPLSWGRSFSACQGMSLCLRGAGGTWSMHRPLQFKVAKPAPCDGLDALQYHRACRVAETEMNPLGFLLDRQGWCCTAAGKPLAVSPDS